MDQLWKAIHVSGVMPFVLKTYAMVEDPNCDSIISWTTSRTSFIVKDEEGMSNELLPKNFNTRKFTSFIRQLNYYGFKRVSKIFLEYENQWFQKGKPELLINIQSPKTNRPKRKNQGSVSSSFNTGVELSSVINDDQSSDPTNYNTGVELPSIINDDQSSYPTDYNTAVELPSLITDDRQNRDMEAELDNLWNALELSKINIQKLKLRRDDMRNQLAFFKEQMENEERESKRVVMFMAKAWGEAFLQDVLQQFEDVNERGSFETGKKRRLSASYIPEISDETLETEMLLSVDDYAALSKLHSLLVDDPFFWTSSYTTQIAGQSPETETQTLLADDHSPGTNQEMESENVTLSETQKLPSDDPVSATNQDVEMENCSPREDAYRVAFEMANEFDDTMDCGISAELSAEPFKLDDEEAFIQLWA